MKAYTTEQINEINSRIDKAIEDRNTDVLIPLELIKDWMIGNNHRKQDKPFGKPYELFGFVVWWVNENTWFGFGSSGRWIDSKMIKLDFDKWQPYPQEKWEAMLLEYAKSRGYKNGNYKCLNPHHITQTIDNQRFEIVNGDVYIVGTLNQNKIFDSKTGVWAEIIEVEEPKEVFDFGVFTLNFETIDPNRYTLDEWIEIMKLGLERKKSEQ